MWASFAADAAHLVGLNITAVDMLGKHVGDEPGQVRSLTELSSVLVFLVRSHLPASHGSLTSTPRAHPPPAPLRCPRRCDLTTVVI